MSRSKSRNGVSSAMDIPASHPKFSFWVGVCFTLNYVVGSGFLTLPWAFEQTGAFLGVLVLAIFSYFSILATCFILEAMVRASMLLESDSDIELRRVDKRVDKRGYSAITDTSDHAGADTVIQVSAGTTRVKSTAALEAKGTNLKRRIEMTELCDLFLGPTGRSIFSGLIGVYMYGTLWAYCTVFAKAFAVQFALSGEEHPEEGSTFYIYLFVFACAVIPLSLMELSEQIYIQVTLTVFRGVMLLMMLLSTGIAYMSCTDAFGDLSNMTCDASRAADPAEAAHGSSSLTTVHFDKLYLFLPIAAYAYIFHHSVPALSEPVEDKRSLGRLFTIALLIAFVGYALLGVCLSAYFGEDSLTSSNLDWRHYQGVLNADGSTPWYAPVVSCFVVLFPALDVASAYPLNAFTLGNNLMSAYYGEDMHLHEKSRAKLSFFRLLAALPPFVGACLVNDLGHITAFTGLTGFAIAFVVPALLGYFSAQRMRELGLSEHTVHSSAFTGTVAQYVLGVSGTLLIVTVAASLLIHGASGR